MHPFLDLKGLSSSQLFDKASELMNYISVNNQNGRNLQVSGQLEMALNAVYDEISERQGIAEAALLEKEDPVSWDMETALSSKRNRRTDAESEDKKDKKRRWRPTERERRDRGA